MRLILTLCFIFLASNVFASKVFYNKDNGKEIVDLSGAKTIDDIKKEYGDGNYEEIITGNTESYRIKNNKIEVYDYIAEYESAKQAKETERRKPETGLRTN